MTATWVDPRATLAPLVVETADGELDLSSLVVDVPVFDLTAEQVSQLTLNLRDPDLDLLNHGVLAFGTVLRYEDLRFEVAAVEFSGPDVPTLVVTARSQGAQRMRRDRGEMVWNDLTPTELLATKASEFGLAFVGEETPRRAFITRTGVTAQNRKGESTWDVGVKLAAEEGSWFFEVAGTLFFGRPTWLIGMAPNAPIPFGTKPPQATGPKGSGSPDDPDAIPTAATPGTAGYNQFTAGLSHKFYGYLADDPGVGWGVSHVEIAALARNAGFVGTDIVLAVAVCLAESSGNANARNVNTNGTVDYGLWQINSVHRASGFDPNRGFDPVYNAEWAHRVWAERQSRVGDGWRAWSSYNSGRHVQYVDDAQAAVQRLQDADPGGTVPGSVPGAGSGVPYPGMPRPRTPARADIRTWVVRWPGGIHANELTPLTVPVLRRSTDAPDDGATLDFLIGYEQALLMRPGDAIAFFGLAMFEVPYIVTHVPISLDGHSDVLVSAREPRDPIPKPGVLPDPTATMPLPAELTSTGWTRPTAGRIISPFGACRPKDGNPCGRRHEGIDMAGAVGDAVVAGQPGRVAVAESRGNYGLVVYIDHAGGWQSRYAHLSRIAMSVGQEVQPGELVGDVGDTGNARGGVPHLHFESRQNRQPIDPAQVLGITT